MSLVSVAPELVVTAVPDVARIGSSIGTGVGQCVDVKQHRHHVRAVISAR